MKKCTCHQPKVRPLTTSVLVSLCETGGCKCRVGDYMKGDSDCPEVKGKNLQYALYALGIEVRRTIVDLVSYEPDEDGVATSEVVTVKRQECFTRNVPYEKEDTTGLIASTEVECYQCLICQPNGGGVDSCNTFGEYPADFPALTDGCEGYSTEPASPVGPEPVRRLRA